MSQLWHYQFIKSRGRGHQWRIADEEDTVVGDRGTEKAALQEVEAHNKAVRKEMEKRLRKHKDRWDD